MTFELPKVRTEFLTAEQAVAIRDEARSRGYPSIALAQAFALMLRQKDVIGEWVPVYEPGPSDVVAGNSKWLNGLHWSNVGQNLKLRKQISKTMRAKMPLRIWRLAKPKNMICRPTR